MAVRTEEKINTQKVVNFKRINFVRREQGYTQPPSSLTADLCHLHVGAQDNNIKKGFLGI